MRLRVLIFDDDAGVRELLAVLCERRGYEVFTFPHPGCCPLHVMDRCPCAPGMACADIIISDLQMPQVEGLDFVEALLAKRCRVPHLALMSGAWSEGDQARATALGCRLFAKPFSLGDIDAWLTTVEALVRPDHGLLVWDGPEWRSQPPASGSFL